MNDDLVAITGTVSGRVQGVGFRVSTEWQARALRLTGWVRNLPDGRVDAVFEGPRLQVSAVLDWCRQGPAISRVDEVDIQWEDFKGEFDGFSITG